MSEEKIKGLKNQKRCFNAKLTKQKNFFASYLLNNDGYSAEELELRVDALKDLLKDYNSMHIEVTLLLSDNDRRLGNRIFKF
jgi:hypothetical protein